MDRTSIRSLEDQLLVFTSLFLSIFSSSEIERLIFAPLIHCGTAKTHGKRADVSLLTSPAPLHVSEPGPGPGFRECNILGLRDSVLHTASDSGGLFFLARQNLGAGLQRPTTNQLVAQTF